MAKNLLSTSEFIKKYDLNAKKSLGQNFILDKNFTDKIAKSAVNKGKKDFAGEIILEIGPGPACLTRSILDLNPKKLIVIEKDERCIKILQEIQEFYGKDKLEIINEDALLIDEEKILQEIFKDNFSNEKNYTNKPNYNISVNSKKNQENSVKNFENDEKMLQNATKFKIISNLPYNIGTVLLIKWFKIIDKISSMTLMLQKEVAQRISAKVNDKNYGRISVLTQLFAESKILFEVNKNIFTPPPKVTSAIIQISPLSKPICEIDVKILEKLTFFAFNQRRKMIKSSLKNVDFTDNLKIDEVLSKININSELRAQNLTIIDFCNIAKFVKID